MYILDDDTGRISLKTSFELQSSQRLAILGEKVDGKLQKNFGQFQLLAQWQLLMPPPQPAAGCCACTPGAAHTQLVGAQAEKKKKKTLSSKLWGPVL